MRTIGLGRRQASEETSTALRAAMARVGRRLRAQERPGGIGATGLSILGTLRRNGPMPIGKLAANERLQPQSLTRIVVDLEERELVSRTRDRTDRRRAYIAITATGEARLRESMRLRDEWFGRAIESKLSDPERDLLRIAATLLDRLADSDDEVSLAASERIS